jgi:hypothetical protein
MIKKLRKVRETERQREGRAKEREEIGRWKK